VTSLAQPAVQSRRGLSGISADTLAVLAVLAVGAAVRFWGRQSE
jgi:hypothetical protein